MSIDPKKPTPLYQQVANAIRSDIESGKLALGGQLSSHKELSRKYEVSLITIKRALNELIHEGVLYSRTGKGTFVHDRAQTKHSLGTKTIGLVLRDLHSPFFSKIVQSVEEYASRMGYNLLLSNSSQQIEKEENLIRHFHNIGVNGLIIASMTHEYTAPHFLRQIQQNNYPFVAVSYIKDPDICFVGTDHERGGYIATKHLLSLGFRLIGYVNGEEGNIVGELRKSGYLSALNEEGISPLGQFLFRLKNRGEEHDYQSGYEIGEQFVKLERRPEAMFVYNDLAALGFEQAVLDRGLRVPDDVAIVGFDGIERGQYAKVPLTTIQQPFDKIGSIAVENLIRKIEGQTVQTRTVLVPTLVTRESCGVRRVKIPQ